MTIEQALVLAAAVVAVMLGAVIVLRLSRVKRLKVGALEVEDHQRPESSDSQSEIPSARASSQSQTGILTVLRNRFRGSVGDISGVKVEGPQRPPTDT